MNRTVNGMYLKVAELSMTQEDGDAVEAIKVFSRESSHFCNTLIDLREGSW